jgi:hypothetical protein
MKNYNKYGLKKNAGRNGNLSSRDPYHQNFDMLDTFHEFTDIHVINLYRQKGEEIMTRNFWK